MKNYKKLSNLDYLKKVPFKNPKIVGLVTPGGKGGSHYILHKLQGHPNLAALEEKVFEQGSEFKNYFRNSWNKVKNELGRQQLLPKKKMDDNIKCIIMNKPLLSRLVYHRNFHYNDISLIQCLRNPIAYYYSWNSGWKNYGKNNYGVEPDENMTFHWFERNLLSSLYEFAQFYDPDKDCVVSVEQFACHTNYALKNLFNHLNVDVLTNNQLIELHKCVKCNNEDLIIKECEIHADNRIRIEDALYCNSCNSVQLGPGHYNYIRKEASNFASWKQKENAEQVYERLASRLGIQFMDYFVDELYLYDKDGSDYKSRLENLIDRLYIGSEY